MHDDRGTNQRRLTHIVELLDTGQLIPVDTIRWLVAELGEAWVNLPAAPDTAGEEDRMLFCSTHLDPRCQECPGPT